MTITGPEILPTATACCFTTLASVVGRINSHWKRRWSMESPGICFRGADRSEYDLNPSLLREPYPQDSAKLALLENNLAQDFARRSRPLLGRQVSSAWESMSIMQQHGLPTRLLDWSRALAVAAHFAVRNLDAEEDGAVWMMAARHLMEIRAIPGAWKTSVGSPTIQPLALRDNDQGLDEFNALTPVVVDPDQLVPRLVVQRGVYTIHSFRRFALEDLAIADRAEHGDACFLHKVLIPSAQKCGFRSEIMVVAGVTEETLFPDLDGFARDFVMEHKRIASGEVGPGSGDLR